MDINGNSGTISQFFVCLHFNLVFVIKNKGRVMLVWELEYVQ